MTNAVCDSGPITHLWQVNRWAAFQTFDSLHVPDVVASEVAEHVRLELLAQVTSLHEHLIPPETLSAIRRNAPAELQQQPTDLAVLALAQQIQPDLVLTDDLTLRRVLEAYAHTAMGSVGILLRAYRSGVIQSTELNAAIDALFTNSTLYLSPIFKDYVRRLIADAIGRGKGRSTQ